MEEEIYSNIKTNEMVETVVIDDNVNYYMIFKNIYGILSVLTFVIIVIFLYKYLKAIIKVRR